MTRLCATSSEVTVGEFFGPNRVDGDQDGDPFSAALRSAAEAFALVGAPIVVTACTMSRDALAGLLEQCPERRRDQARTLRRKFFRPSVRKSTLNAMMAG
jgi:hypothetical protein